MVTKKQNKITQLWDKLSNTSKRLSLIVAIIGSITFLYPKINATYKVSKEYLEFLSRGIEIKNDLDNLEQYHIVLSSILRANMKKIEYEGHTKYGTLIGSNIIEVKLRESVTGDIFVFVPDGKAGAYSVKFNKDENKFSYIDFDGQHHFIEYLD